MNLLKKIPFFKIGVTVFIFWMIIANTDMKQCWDAAKHISYLDVAIVFCLFWVLQVFVTKRWSAVLDTQKHHFTFSELFRPVFIGYLFNQGLPSSIGGDVYRVIALKDYISWASSFSSILFERLLGFLCFGIIISIMTIIEWQKVCSTELLWPILTSLSLFFGVFSVVVILVKIPQRWTEKLPFADKIAPFISLTQTVFKDPQHFLQAFGYSFCVSLTGVGAAFMLANGMDVVIDFQTSLMVFPVVFVIASLPISIGGWGLREGVVVVTLGVYGISHEQALAFSLIYGVLQLLSSLPGIFFLFQRDKEQLA